MQVAEAAVSGCDDDDDDDDDDGDACDCRCGGEEEGRHACTAGGGGGVGRGVRDAIAVEIWKIAPDTHLCKVITSNARDIR